MNRIRMTLTAVVLTLATFSVVAAGAVVAPDQSHSHAVVAGTGGDTGWGRVETVADDDTGWGHAGIAGDDTGWGGVDKVPTVSS
jgi:hypothetical protein